MEPAATTPPEDGSKVDSVHHEDLDSEDEKAVHTTTSEIGGFEADSNALEEGYYSSMRFWGSMVAIGMSTKHSFVAFLGPGQSC
jgi:hypothetical protein